MVVGWGGFCTILVGLRFGFDVWGLFWFGFGCGVWFCLHKSAWALCWGCGLWLWGDVGFGLLVCEGAEGLLLVKE